MATLYFSSTGDINNAGTLAAPYPNLRQAELQSSSGDTLVNVDTCQESLDGSLTLGYTGGTFEGSYDVSENAIIPYLTFDTHCEAIASDPAWVNSAATVDDASSLYGSNCYLQDGLALGRLRQMDLVPDDAIWRMVFLYQNLSNASCKIEMKDNEANLWYDFALGTFNAGVGTHEIFADSGGAWAIHTTDWITPVDTSSRAQSNMRTDWVTGAGGAGVESRLQRSYWEFQVHWVQHSGDVYQTPLMTSGATSSPNMLWKGTDRAVVPKSASLAAIAAGEFWHEQGIGTEKGRLYYQLAAGETAAQLQDGTIQLRAQMREEFITDTGAATIYSTTIQGYKSACITSTGASRLEDLTIDKNYFYNVRCTGAGSITFENLRISNSEGNQRQAGADHSKGIFNSGGGTITGTGLWIDNVYDDGIQSTNGNITVNGFLVKNSTIGSGISLHTENTFACDLVAKNGTIYHKHNTVGGIRDQNSNAGNKLTLHSVAVVMDESLTVEAMEYGTGTADADLTDSGTDNRYNGTVNAAYGAYTTAIADLATFKMTDLVNFVPQSDSPLIGASDVTDTLKVSANGEPFPRVNKDIGGIQSTHNAFHPVNL